MARTSVLQNNFTMRDLFDVYDDLDEGRVDQVKVGSYDTISKRDSKYGFSFKDKNKGTTDYFQTAENLGEDMVMPDGSKENLGYRQSILNYGAKKREIAATKRAGYTGTSSILGGSAL